MTDFLSILATHMAKSPERTITKEIDMDVLATVRSSRNISSPMLETPTNVREKAEAILQNNANDCSPTKVKLDKAICEIYMKGMRFAHKAVKVDLEEPDTLPKPIKTYAPLSTSKSVLTNAKSPTNINATKNRTG